MKRDAHSAKSKHELFHIMYARYAMTAGWRSAFQSQSAREKIRSYIIIYKIRIYQVKWSFAILCVHEKKLCVFGCAVLCIQLYIRRQSFVWLKLNQQQPTATIAVKTKRKQKSTTLVIMQGRFHAIFFSLSRIWFLAHTEFEQTEKPKKSNLFFLRMKKQSFKTFDLVTNADLDTSQ